MIFVLVISIFCTALADDSDNQNSIETSGTVNMILFVKSDCSVCRASVLPFLTELKDKYKKHINILVVDNSDATGGNLYLKGLMSGMFQADQPLPLLLSENISLAGSENILSQLSDLVEHQLNQNGSDWRAIDGLNDILFKAQAGNDSAVAYFVSPDSSSLLSNFYRQSLKNFNKDITGNSIALLVLVGMILAWIKSLSTLFGKSEKEPINKWLWLSPVLMIIGMCAAGYLMVTGMFNGEAACGPVGDCNAVQQSDYALLFGSIPVSLPGMLSYLAILGLWLFYMVNRSSLRCYAIFTAWGVSFIGVSFFIYLTFPEPFIIGASCAWCLTSATAMTLQMLILNPPARSAWIGVIRYSHYTP